MLASKIEDFSIFGGSKRPSKFHLFLHRFFIDFGSVLASNMGPSWGPRRPKIRKNGSKKLFRSSPFAVLETNLLLKTVQEPLGLDFWGVRARFSMIFGWFFELLCQVNPRTCRGQSWESKKLPRTKPRRKSVRTPPRKLKSPSFVLPNSFPYRNPPYSKNLGRRYSPPGGLQ